MPHSTAPSMDVYDRKVAIIGAGIGGLALAIGLLRQHVPFTLYESAPKYSAIGAGVGLGPNALNAMDNLDERLRPLYDKISSGNLTPNKDHVMFDALYAEEGLGEARGWKPAPFGADCYERTSAHRVDLLNIMTSLIPAGNVQFNKRLSRIEQMDDKVCVSFEDGDVVEASAVIGADGVKGPTRKVVLGSRYPDNVEAAYSGKYAYRSVIPMKDAMEIIGSENAGDARSFLGQKHNFIAFPISRGTQCNLVAFKFDDRPWTYDQWTMKVSRAQMEDDFADGVDKRIVKLLDWAEPIQWAIFHHIDTPTYYNGLVCLLGDSAHATSPHQAAGAGQCIEDALILSYLLGQVEDQSQMESAFEVYDSIRRPRAQRVVQTSYEMGQMYSFSHPGYGSDIDRIVGNFNGRFAWLWEHDLEADLRRAEQQFRSLTT